jgi:hypothetical protein
VLQKQGAKGGDSGRVRADSQTSGSAAMRKTLPHVTNWRAGRTMVPFSGSKWKFPVKSLIYDHH